MSKADTTIEADLARVAGALATGRVTSTDERDRELEALVIALAQETPEPAPDFAARLGEQVREGFPRRRRRPRVTFGRPPMPALAGLAAGLITIAVAVPLIGDGNPQTGGAPSGDMSIPTLGDGQDGGSAAQAPAPMTVPVPPADGELLERGEPSGGDFRPGQSARRIQRSAMLTLAAPANRLDRVADEIVSVTDRLDGFVLQSSVASGEDALSGGEFELRVPAARLRTALARLSELGTVRARSQAGEDVTSSFISVSDRLEGARAQRRGLLRRLENADTDTEAEALRRSLDVNAGEVSRLRGELRELRQSTDYATIEVSLERKEADPGAGASTDGVGGAIEDAIESLSDSAELAIRAVGVALPLALLAALMGFGGRLALRRRREAALR